MPTLLAGTNGGIVRVDGRSFDSIEWGLEGTPVISLAVDASDRILAASDDGLYRSGDAGARWTDLDVPVSSTRSVDVEPDSGTIYCGTRPAAAFRSTDDGDSWVELAGLQHVDGADAWPTSPHFDVAQVRAIGTTQGPTETVVAGIEVGGLVRSDDGGETWRSVSDVPDDVHHVHCETDTDWVVSCGTGGPSGVGGVYRTTDGGEHWRRLDTGERPYVRESIVTDRLYTAGNRTGPLWEPADAALLVERDGELESVSYPGEPTSFVISWTSDGERVYAGTNTGDVLMGSEGGWERLGRIPVDPDDAKAYGVRSLLVV